MAFAAAVTDQFKQDILNGVHQPADVYKIALVLQVNATNCNKLVTNYSAGAVNVNGEVTGTGYSAGGTALSGFTVGISGDTAYINFTNPSWTGSTITADGAVIYNSSRSGKVLAVIAFGSTTTTSGTFQVQFPAAGATAVITIT